MLWVLTGAVLTGNLQSAVGAIPSGGAPGSGLAQSLLHAGVLLAALALWARYLDRRQLGAYGASATPGWLLDALVGFSAVALGFVAWNVLGAALGTMTVAVGPSLPEGSVLSGLAVPLLALSLHAAAQQVVFFGVALRCAAEGLHSRGLAPQRAGLVALPVAAALFVLMHGEVTVLRTLDLAVAGGVFGLLYLQSGELAFGIGAHVGALYGGIVLSAVLRTGGSLPGVLGVSGQYGFPKMMLGYLLVLAWLRVRERGLAVQGRSAPWTAGEA